MTFDFPLRARCVTDHHPFFRRGDEVKVLRMLGAYMCVVEHEHCEGITNRSHFKPVIRVQA